jgi:hypothetical protein
LRTCKAVCTLRPMDATLCSEAWFTSTMISLITVLRIRFFRSTGAADHSKLPADGRSAPASAPLPSSNCTDELFDCAQASASVTPSAAFQRVSNSAIPGDWDLPRRLALGPILS